VAPLVAHFARRAAARFGVDAPRVPPDLVAELSARPWPGNVRELENVVTRWVALGSASEAAAPAEAAGLAAQVAAFEKALVARAIADAGGNRSEAARRLGLSRVTLLDKLKRHGLA
ncbi:MAG: sigma-54-dependent Fis family transcriptional regulator, partial [Myxococcales bacterium]|nr:sigma-54-dependent Fis family transcriptional regulator [Myxococcales bacterium]